MIRSNGISGSRNWTVVKFSNTTVVVSKPGAQCLWGKDSGGIILSEHPKLWPRVIIYSPQILSHRHGTLEFRIQ